MPGRATSPAARGRAPSAGRRVLAAALALVVAGLPAGASGAEDAVREALARDHRANGTARLLTDAELDATWAQGLVIVDVRVDLRDLAGRFDFAFASQTAIHVPDRPAAGMQPAAGVSFLGGLVSLGVDASQGLPASTQRSLDLGPAGSVSFSVYSSGGGSAAAAPAAPVVTFGAAPASGRTRLIDVTARDIGVDTKAHVAIGGAVAARSAARAAATRAIRGAMGTTP